MTSVTDRQFAATHALYTISLLQETPVLKTDRTWRIRVIIAAHRACNSEKMTGLGYGPDWHAYIKQDVINFLRTGKLPYVIERMMRELQSAAQPHK